MQNLKSDEDKLDITKLQTITVDLTKLSDAAAKKTVLKRLYLNNVGLKAKVPSYIPEFIKQNIRLINKI